MSVASDREVDPDGVIRFGHPRSPSAGFDPHLSSLNHDNVFLEPVYETLIIENADAELVPGLATKWRFVGGGNAFELQLRDGVTFHDGAAFDAGVVKANIERLQTVDGGVLDLDVVTRVEVVDPYTVRFHLAGGAADLPRALADRPGMMISPDALDAPDLQKQPVGAGMFRLVEYREGGRAVYERFDDYWNPDSVRAAGLEIITMPSPTTRFNALRSGQANVVSIHPTQVDQAKDAGMTTITEDGMHRQIVQFNRTRSEFDDVRVRQALNYAVDREAIAHAVYEGLAAPSAQYYTSGYPLGHVPELEGLYTYDPQRARQLLDEAGLADGFSFELLVPTDPARQSIAEILQVQWAEIGVTANLRQVEISQLGPLFYGRNEGDAIIGELTGVTEPTEMALAFFLPETFTNPGGHSIPRVNKAYEAAIATGSDAARTDEVKELMRAMVEEAGLVIVLHPYRAYAMTPSVDGFEVALNGIASFRGVGVAAG